MLNLRMETGEGGAQHIYVTHCRPRFGGGAWFGLTRHKVDIAAVWFDIVDDDVAVRPPPFSAIVDPIAVEQCRRINRAVSNTARKIRLILSEQYVPDYRMNTVGADHGVGIGRRAVGKAEPDAAVHALADGRDVDRFWALHSPKRRVDRL